MTKPPHLEVLGDHAIDMMEEKGWTPNQVYALIVQYRALQRDIRRLEKKLEKISKTKNGEH
jgi:hypothetical protein